MSAVSLAYGPVWAIGTGVTASRQQDQEVFAVIREPVANINQRQLVQEIRILYSDSAKPGNAAELMSEKDVDGLLVGGASLKADDFVAIIKAAV